MKLGITVKIDVSKIDKDRLFKGEKGTYLDCTTFIDTENPGQFGNHGFISQAVSKEERDQGAKGAILGNCKIFYSAESPGIPPQNPQVNNNQSPGPGSGNYHNGAQAQQQAPQDGFDTDIPF